MNYLFRHHKIQQKLQYNLNDYIVELLLIIQVFLNVLDCTTFLRGLKSSW